MKKILFFAASLFFLISCTAQNRSQPIGSPKTDVRILGGAAIDSFFVLPVVRPLSSKWRVGMIAYQVSDSSVYTYTGYQWLKVNGGGAGGGASNLATVIGSNTIQITNDNGSGFDFPIADGLQAGAVDAFRFNQWNNKLSVVDISVDQSANKVDIKSSAGATGVILPVDNTRVGVMTPAMLASFNGKISTVVTAGSIEGNGNGLPLKLIGDLTNPGPNKVYGTNGIGTRVWKDDPAGGGGGASTDWINITLAQLDVGIGLDSNKIYFITDNYKQGPFRNAGLVANQTTDNGGTRVVSADNRAWDRIYDGIIRAEWFDVVPDAQFTGGTYATGTNSSIGLQKAINASGAGQRIWVPGNVYLPDVLDSIKSKTLWIEFLGNTYQAGNDLLIFTNGSGPYEQHYVKHWGIARDRINIPTHSKATYDANTDPPWHLFTGSFAKMYNTSQVWIDFNMAEGFRTPAEIITDALGGLNGSQENIIIGRKFTLNAIGASLKLKNGTGYNDKSKWYVQRVSGDVAVYIDGFGSWMPGDTFNGANTSLEFHMLWEQLNKGAVTNADVRTPIFDVTIENGPQTGIFSDTAFYFEDAGLANVENPTISVGGILASWMLAPPNKLGFNGEITKPIWNGGNKYGSSARIDGAGLILVRAKTSVRQDIRNTAPSNFRFIEEDEFEAEVTTTSRFFSITSDSLRFLNYNYPTAANGFVYFPLANNMPKKYVTIYNNSPYPVSISGVSGFTSLPDTTVMTFYSNGSIWRPTTTIPDVISGAALVPAVVGSTPNTFGFTYNSGTGGFNLQPADSTFPGAVKVGAQNLGEGKRLDSMLTRKIRLVNAGAGFTALDITRTQNGISFGSGTTANSSSATLTAFEFPSGSSTKDAVFTIGKTGVNAGHFGLNSTDFFITPEKSTGGVEFRNGIAYNTYTLTGGSLLGKIFGSGNWLIQRAGVATDAGYRLDVQGTMRVTGIPTFSALATASTQMAVINTDGTMGVQTIPAGGSGGSTIFTAGSGTGSPYYRTLGSVNFGVNPAQSWAWSHWGASTSTKGIWEFTPGVKPTVMRAHSWAYDGTDIWFADNLAIPRKVLLEGTNGVFSGSYEGFDIDPERIDIGTTAKGDVFESNGTDGARIVKPRYALPFSQVGSISSTASTSGAATTLIVGGAQTFSNATLVAGDVLELTGSGTYVSTSGSNSPTLVFNFASGGTVSITNGDLQPSWTGNFKYKMRVIPQAAGTSVTVAYDIEIYFTTTTAGPIILSGTRTGFNATSPVINVTGYWDAAGNTMTSLNNTIEIKRKPAP
jgi:hypothetical protein